jgi:CRISPR-associated protein (TIGR03984 family)
MAEESKSVETKLFISRAEKKTLAEAVTSYVAAFNGKFEKAVALLYAPHECFLAVVDKNGKLWGIDRDSKSHDQAKIDVTQQAIFEARVFNESAELRWLNEADGKGAAVVLSESNEKKFFDKEAEAFLPSRKELVGRIDQTYLVWGQSTGASQNDWTQLAEARIGSFFVPVDGITKANQRAQFTAFEYLGEYEDGNVAVAEERLIGIKVAVTEEKQNG